MCAWVKPIFRNGVTTFSVEHTGKSDLEGTISRKGAVCAFCRTPVEFSYIREEGRSGRMGEKLCAIVAEGNAGRIYLSPDIEHILVASVDRPVDYPDAILPTNPRDFKTPNYGLIRYAELFTNRQLVALTTFCKLVLETKEKVVEDSIKSGLFNDYIGLRDGGNEATAYGEAISVYLSFVIDKMTDYHSTICSWNPPREGLRNTFGRQAIPMVWDYAEANPFSDSSGCFDNMLEWVYKCLIELPVQSREGIARQVNAQSDCVLRGLMISTDPPYYDNIGYADLSDYFYIWMRRTIKEIYPELFGTMLVPKTEELIATPYRHDGSEIDAKEFFENGMLNACKKFNMYSCDEVPVTIYYAYKQSDIEVSEEKVASSGWETMLTAIIQAGFSITGTWPMSTERTGRTIGNGANALASSIVLVCRKRMIDAKVCTRRGFINELKRELRPALKKLQASNIAPVDLAQSAIGPGMGVFSKYKQVLESDGTPMTVRSALQIINQELDIYFNEQDGELDRESRFCVELYTQYAFNDVKFGEADTLARAKNTSVAALASQGVLYAQKGTVHLYGRNELSDKALNNDSIIWLLTQQLTKAMETGGIEACARIVAPMLGSNAEYAKSLAYRLYTIAERKGWAQEAYAYNSLVIAWSDIQSRAAQIQAYEPEQMDLFSMGGFNTKEENDG